jgi:5'-deoxynucleotidase YfbR-like HD superfamily hydrolase
MKMAVSWDTDVSEVLTGSIITPVKEAEAPLNHQSISTRLQVATSQKTAIYILAVRT